MVSFFSFLSFIYFFSILLLLFFFFFSLSNSSSLDFGMAWVMSTLLIH